MQVYFLIPGDINTISGGYIYNKRIIDGLKTKGHEVVLHQLHNDFPFPGENSIQHCREFFDQLPFHALVVIDSLVLGPMLPVLTEFYGRFFIIALMHLPLSHNLELPVNQRGILAQQERSVLSLSSKIIVTSVYTQRLFFTYDIDPANIQIILPGVDTTAQKNVYPAHPTKLLCISNYMESKGQLLLLESLSTLKKQNWILNCYGSQEFDKEFVTLLSSVVHYKKLANRIFINGPLSGTSLTQAYLDADLFILPSYFETYGMVLTEALAHGVPVIASMGGGILDTVPATMGLFFKPGDVSDLKSAIRILLTDSFLYHELCKEASTYHNRVNEWSKSIDMFEQVLIELSIS